MTEFAEKNWSDRLHGDTPCVVAARLVLRRRLCAVRRWFPRAVERHEEDLENVHQLRVASRRGEAVLEAFQAFCGPRLFERVRKRLRGIRQAAGAARQHDVASVLLAKDAASCSRDYKRGYAYLLRELASKRAEAQETIGDLGRRRRRGISSKLRRRLIESVRFRSKPVRNDEPTNGPGSPPIPYSLLELAIGQLPALIDPVAAACSKTFVSLDDAHQLRIETKKLRYALELFECCLAEAAYVRVYGLVQGVQERLGTLNDYHEVHTLIQALVDSPGRTRRPIKAELIALTEHYGQERDRRLAEFAQWWSSPDTREQIEELRRIVPARSLRPGAPAGHGNGAGVRAAAKPAESGLEPPLHRRVAAIDAGTNSIRLVVAETDPMTKFRVIEDIKETTRLGAGVHENGRLDAASVERSLAALLKMKQIADGFHVDRLRAVGTSALREAEDADAFITLAARHSGVSIEVIDAEHEARLAFSSVVNAFDLEDRRVVIADIGGGSTELVLSTSGVIEAIHPLPLGALWLAENFCRESDQEGCQFEELCRAIEQAIQQEIDPPAQAVELMIGTGGTFTSLARVTMREGTSGNGGRFPFALRGYELRRQDVSALLDRLRRMSAAERRGVPGLSAQRSEIIVPGLCILERLMEHLGIGRVRVHDGGIRDGLLSEMVDDLGIHPFLPRRRSVQMVDIIRTFAERNDYEQEHSEHVARLALQIFDQLASESADASGTWASRHCRNLLQAAAVAHDVGMLIEWKNHHTHSYDMLIHAQLPTLTHREVELIANIARYHRGPAPRPSHENFHHLGDDDQRLVRHLAGILRVADGLDRLHTQNVTGVTVGVEAEWVRFEAHAEDNPTVNLEFARKKADLFEGAFHGRTKFRWQQSPARAAVLRVKG